MDAYLSDMIGILANDEAHLLCLKLIHGFTANMRLSNYVEVRFGSMNESALLRDVAAECIALYDEIASNVIQLQ